MSPREKTPRSQVIVMHGLYMEGYKIDDITEVFELAGGKATLYYLFEREELPFPRQKNLAKLGG